MKKLNDYVKAYKQQLKSEDIQTAYVQLVKYMMELDTHMSKKMSGKYSFGSIFQGYMDYTYFYYANDFLKDRKLKLGLVLNHKEVRFELWLLGQTKPLQEKYWQLFKSTKWCEGLDNKPQYAVFETVLIKDPDFNELDALTKQIESELQRTSDLIIRDLREFK